MKKILRNIAVSLFLLTISACTTVPFSNRTQYLLLTSAAEENQMGAQAWQDIKSKEKLSSNNNHKTALNRVALNIASISNKPDFNWEFAVFESEQANAFCLPGGKIAVYSGLFKFTENDAELAAVVGHEIAHALARHGGERVSQGYVQAIGSKVIAAAGNKEAALWQLAYGAVTQVGAVLPYSRLHEYEADYIGLILMAKAGYNPNAAVTFWKKFSKLSQQQGAIQEFLSTHPIGQKRVDNMLKKLPEAMRIYNKHSKKLGNGRQY